MRFKRVYIEITNVCNLKCPFCLPHNRESRFMTFDEFKLILEKIRTFTNYIYLHVKGEPLLHPNVDEFIKYAFEMGFKINLTTNATMLEKHLEITKYLRQINISLHATNNLDIVETAKKIQDAIVCFRIWNIDKDIKNKTLLENEFNVSIPQKENFTLAPNIFLSQKNEFTWPSLKNEVTCAKKYCYGLINQIGILADGTVVPCCLDNNGDINLGNIFREDFNAIITSERAEKIISGFKNSIAVEELCKKCTFKDN